MDIVDKPQCRSVIPSTNKTDDNFNKVNSESNLNEFYMKTTISEATTNTIYQNQSISISNTDYFNSYVKNQYSTNKHFIDKTLKHSNNIEKVYKKSVTTMYHPQTEPYYQHQHPAYTNYSSPYSSGIDPRSYGQQPSSFGTPSQVMTPIQPLVPVQSLPPASSSSVPLPSSLLPLSSQQYQLPADAQEYTQILPDPSMALQQQQQEPHLSSHHTQPHAHHHHHRQQQPEHEQNQPRQQQQQQHSSVSALVQPENSTWYQRPATENVYDAMYLRNR